MLDCSKLKELDDSGGKYLKMVENTMGKGEIARYEQFLLFSQCLKKKTLYCGHIKTRACLGKG